MSKLTPWFPPSMKPVRDGKYEVLSADGSYPFSAYWNNGCWRYGPKKRDGRFRLQERSWRGLAKAPK